MSVEWVEVAPSAPGACDGKPGSHKFFLSAEEGRFNVGAASCCDECMCPGPDFDFVAMDDIEVTVEMATGCPAYDTDESGVPTGPPRPMGGYESGSHYIAHGTRCDCDWWPVIRRLGCGTPGCGCEQ